MRMKMSKKDEKGKEKVILAAIKEDLDEADRLISDCLAPKLALKA